MAAHLLHARHSITVFEAARSPGGHVHTVDVALGGERFAVDTGFIVYNRENYPAFSRLLDELGIRTRKTTMSFSVRDEASGYEYSTRTLGALFAQPKNALSAAHWRFVRDLSRLSRHAADLLSRPEQPEEPTLAEWLEREGYGPELTERFVMPIGAALWSTRRSEVREFPARFFVRFLDNHRMLARRGKPEWRVVSGGSRSYVDRLVAPFRERIRLECAVQSVRRFDDHVGVRAAGAGEERFDRVVIATHSDTALALLDDATPGEREILGAIRYQDNEAVLHTDRSMLPRSARARASWNYHLLADPTAPASLTYDMNRLQSLRAPENFCVTLNRSSDIAPDKVIERVRFRHPLFGLEAARAQRRRCEISGKSRTHFAGAYWRWGFHEDGVQSALWVADEIERARS
jgi:predicted NAD/FAD-binding protein